MNVNILDVTNNDQSVRFMDSAIRILSEEQDNEIVYTRARKVNEPLSPDVLIAQKNKPTDLQHSLQNLTLAIAKDDQESFNFEQSKFNHLLQNQDDHETDEYEALELFRHNSFAEIKTKNLEKIMQKAFLRKIYLGIGDIYSILNFQAKYYVTEKEIISLLQNKKYQLIYKLLTHKVWFKKNEFLKISHFVQFIDAQDLIKFLMNYQNIDFDETVETIIKRKFNILDSIGQFENKEQFIIFTMSHSIDLQKYDIALECLKIYLTELLAIKYLPCFEILFRQFKNDPSKYEVKIAVLQRMLPLMKTQQSEEIMKIFEQVIENKQIFSQNINPLRVGLNLFKLLDDIQKQFNYSLYSTNNMKNQIQNYIKIIIEVYQDPGEIVPLMECQDILGNDSFFYMKNYSLYKILDSKIMDKFIYEKWKGRIEINSGFLQHSIGYKIINDKTETFQSDDVLDILYQSLFDFSQQNKTHQFKFNVWKKSNQLRIAIEFMFNFILTLFFQLKISQYNRNLHVSRHQIQSIMDYSKLNGKNSIYYSDLEILHHSMQSTGKILIQALTISYLNLLFPFNYLLKYYFLKKTNRNALVFDLLDFLLFVLCLIVLNDWSRFQSLNPQNQFVDLDEVYGPRETFMVNIMWEIHTNGYRFDLRLALLAFLVWFKQFNYFRATRTFGPMLKILQKMLVDLSKFLIIWVIVLIMFSCIAMLAFGELVDFKTLDEIIVFFVESALGDWDMVVYEGENYKGVTLTTLKKLGTYFQLAFLMLNLVLMLNFAIAILSSTFSQYQGFETGLYYEVIIEMLPKRTWDDNYGCLVCAQEPLNIILIVLSPILFISKNTKQINNMICHCLYFPFAILITICFSSLALILAPISYAIQIVILMLSILKQKSVLKAILRFTLTIKFAIYGVIYFPVSIIFDTFNFFFNLYSEPESEQITNQYAISAQSLQLLEDTCDEFLPKNKIIDVSIFIKKLNINCNLIKEFQNLIFDCSPHKFIHNDLTKKKQIAPEYMRKIQNSRGFKVLVFKTAIQNKLDVRLLKSMIEQVQLKYEMIKIQQKHNQIIMLKSDEQIFQDILYELIKCQPKEFRQALVSQNQIMLNQDEKLNQLRANLKQCHQIMDRMHKAETKPEPLNSAYSIASSGRIGILKKLSYDNISMEAPNLTPLQKGRNEKALITEFNEWEIKNLSEYDQS